MVRTPLSTPQLLITVKLIGSLVNPCSKATTKNYQIEAILYMEIKDRYFTVHQIIDIMGINVDSVYAAWTNIVGMDKSVSVFHVLLEISNTFICSGIDSILLLKCYFSISSWIPLCLSLSNIGI